MRKAHLFIWSSVGLSVHVLSAHPSDVYPFERGPSVCPSVCPVRLSIRVSMCVGPCVHLSVYPSRLDRLSGRVCPLSVCLRVRQSVSASDSRGRPVVRSSRTSSLLNMPDRFMPSPQGPRAALSPAGGIRGAGLTGGGGGPRGGPDLTGRPPSAARSAESPQLRRHPTSRGSPGSCRSLWRPWPCRASLSTGSETITARTDVGRSS